MRKYYQYKWSIAIHQELNMKENLMKWQVGHPRLISGSTIFEFIIICIQPLPFYELKIVQTAGYPVLEYTMTLSEILYALMFARLYIIIRFTLRSSIYVGSEARLLWFFFSLPLVWASIVLQQRLLMLLSV
jgi:hypothetical protein